MSLASATLPRLTIKCSLRENKFWKSAQPLHKEWSKRISTERHRRIENMKDTFSFVTDIAKEDAECFKKLHLEAFESLDRNKSPTEDEPTIIWPEITPEEETSKSDIFDKPL